MQGLGLLFRWQTCSLSTDRQASYALTDPDHAIKGILKALQNYNEFESYLYPSPATAGKLTDKIQCAEHVGEGKA